jgi:hypothetical protein
MTVKPLSMRRRVSQRLDRDEKRQPGGRQPEPDYPAGHGRQRQQRQPGVSADGKDWKTNLFVVTSKRDYSLELNVLDKDSPAQAFVIRYRYPDELRKSLPPPAPPVSNISRKHWTGSG